MDNLVQTKKLNYDLGKWFDAAWNLFKAHMWEFILLNLVMMIPGLLIGGVSFVISFADTMQHPSRHANPFPLIPGSKEIAIALGSAILGAMLTYPLLVGISAVALNALRARVFDWDLLWTGFRKYADCFVVGLIAGGLSVVPALFPLTWILFPLWLMIGMWGTIAVFSLAEPEGDMNSAISKGITVVKANIWWAALFELVSGLISGAGIFACCVGIFFTSGFYYALLAVAYNDLSGQMTPAPIEPQE